MLKKEEKKNSRSVGCENRTGRRSLVHRFDRPRLSVITIKKNSFFETTLLELVLGSQGQGRQASTRSTLSWYVATIILGVYTQRVPHFPCLEGTSSPDCLLTMICIRVVFPLPGQGGQPRPAHRRRHLHLHVELHLGARRFRGECSQGRVVCRGSPVHIPATYRLRASVLHCWNSFHHRHVRGSAEAPHIRGGQERG